MTPDGAEWAPRYHIARKLWSNVVVASPIAFDKSMSFGGEFSWQRTGPSASAGPVPSVVEQRWKAMEPVLTRFGVHILLVLGGLAGAPLFAPAAAQPAATYRVVGVGNDDVLNIRTGPSVDYPVAGGAPHDARGIRGLGNCVQGWCHILYRSVMGWSNARFLAADQNALQPPEPRPGGRVLDETLRNRSILKDGTLEIRSADGTTRRRLPDGRTQTLMPDGTLLGPAIAIQVPRSGIFEQLGEITLSIMRSLLNDAEMESYLQFAVWQDL